LYKVELRLDRLVHVFGGVRDDVDPFTSKAEILDLVAPHFHALDQGGTMEVAIDPAGILRGSSPVAHTAVVLGWAPQRQTDRMVHGTFARAEQPLHPIAPAEGPC
jgi:hypothetical protein